MEQEPIIPTRYKAKLPHTLSYPVGAQAISHALFGVPQFEELTVRFQFSNQLARHHGTTTPYRVMEVQYVGPLRLFSASKAMNNEPYYSERWKITVDAVPQSLRHFIQSKIVADVLPSIRMWLIANPHGTEREGSHRLAFVFDELKNELKYEENASIEWQTTKVDKLR